MKMIWNSRFSVHNNVLLGHSHLGILRNCLHVTTPEFNSFKRDYMAHKTENIYSLALYQKNKGGGRLPCPSIRSLFNGFLIYPCYTILSLLSSSCSWRRTWQRIPLHPHQFSHCKSWIISWNSKIIPTKKNK